MVWSQVLVVIVATLVVHFSFLGIDVAVVILIELVVVVFIWIISIAMLIYFYKNSHMSSIWPVALEMVIASLITVFIFFGYIVAMLLALVL